MNVVFDAIVDPPTDPRDELEVNSVIGIERSRSMT